MAIYNGRIPTSLLQYVGLNSVKKKMFVSRGKMARGLDLAIRMFAIYGYSIKLADAYRTYAEQQKAKAYWISQGHPEKAATPGTSNHGMARAVDFASPLNYLGPVHTRAQWLLPLLGFSWDQGETYGEPWHWVWVGFPKRTTLRVGATGRQVRLWQLYIRLTGLRIDGKKIAVDGQYGPTSAKFTKARQKQLKIPATGVVDAKTWARARLS